MMRKIRKNTMMNAVLDNHESRIQVLEIKAGLKKR